MLHAQLQALQRCDIQMECRPAKEAQIGGGSGTQIGNWGGGSMLPAAVLPPHAGHISKSTKPKQIPRKGDVVYSGTSSSPSYDSAGKMQKCQRFVGTHLCVQMLERWAAGGAGADDDDSQSGKTCETWANNYTNMSTRAPSCESLLCCADRPATIIVVYLVLAFSATAQPESRRAAERYLPPLGLNPCWPNHNIGNQSFRLTPDRHAKQWRPLHLFVYQLPSEG